MRCGLPGGSSNGSVCACTLQHWIAYQLLHALAQAHGRGVCHGDIKCENVLVTSWAWVYLADLASYKPTYLPVDNPVSGPYQPICPHVLDTPHCLPAGAGVFKLSVRGRLTLYAK